jgi:hypothetical protein
LVAGLLAVTLLAGCAGSSDPISPAAAGAVAPVVQEPEQVDLPALKTRLRPDVLVTGTLTAQDVRAVEKVAPAAVAYTSGSVRIAGTAVKIAVVDPARFRRFAPEGTAESTAVWQTIASGQLVASHALAKRLKLPLGGGVVVGGSSVRLGALATTGIPGTDLLVSPATAKLLKVGGRTSLVLSAGKSDPTDLAAKVRSAAGDGADVSLLSPPTHNPTAFLTGSRAAKAFGAFSYRYYSDGTIEPDARWVRANIVTTTVPILGTVTCHRLMIPQLRAALREVQRAGLSSKIRTYNGCYVPRFIERDPSRSVSLHTWGIALDLDAATNYRGIRGTMDARVVKIFKRWGFRWGGDWAYTDPMHFELGALIRA